MAVSGEDGTDYSQFCRFASQLTKIAVQIHAKLTVAVTSQSVNADKLYPFLHRLGSVAMLCVSVVLHLSRPVEVGGDRG